MIQLLRPVGVLVWKDILLELRSRDLIVSVLVFGLVVVVVFNFALTLTSQQVATVGAGDSLGRLRLCRSPGHEPGVR